MPRRPQRNAPAGPKDVAGAAPGRAPGRFAPAPLGAGVAIVVALLSCAAALLLKGLPLHPWGQAGGPAAPWVSGLLRCLAQCAALGDASQAYLVKMAARGEGRSPWRLPPEVCGATGRRCDTVAEAFCAGLQCQVNDSGLVGRWFPLEKAITPPAFAPELLQRAEAALASHLECAARCASQRYLTVALGSPPTQAAIAAAVARLGECGVVHLSGGSAWPAQAFDGFARAARSLRALPPGALAELEKTNLRANRTEIFLPFDEALPEPLDSGGVIAVAAGYIGEAFALDYVSVLNARARLAGDQDLHPDVPFFPRTSLSAHTVLEDITQDMGPTLFCPCTHSVTQWEDLPPGPGAAEPIRFATALRSAIRTTGSAAARRCFGAAYVPEELPAGLVTLYDGAVLHAGLANTAAADRVVLNVNLASPPGYEVHRNYTAAERSRAHAETLRWRARAGRRTPAERLDDVRRWVASLPLE